VAPNCEPEKNWRYPDWLGVAGTNRGEERAQVESFESGAGKTGREIGKGGFARESSAKSISGKGKICVVLGCVGCYWNYSWAGAGL